jgi:predicted MFS family arabinose efflux permease
VRGSEPLTRSQLARLQGVGLVSNVDRYVSAPLLVLLTHRFHASLAAVAVVASGHLLAYGLSQLPWVGLLARYGPVLTMRVAMGGAGLSAGVAALAPSLVWLIAARVVGGAFLGAAVPAALLYVGTRVPAPDRPRGFAAIVSANGLGIVLAVAIALLATASDLWWLAYLMTGAVLLACAMAVTGLRANDVSTHHEPGGVDLVALPRRRQLNRVLRTMALVLIEGAIVVGAVVVLPALADGAGHNRQVAAATVAVFGITMPLTGVLLRRWPISFTLAVRVPLAAAVLCLLPFTVVSGLSLIGLVIIAVLLGVAWSALHPVLQSAATTVWPRRTPAVLALFVTALFFGGAVGSQVLAMVAAGNDGLTFTLICTAGGLSLLAVERLTRHVTR